mmetsp:Transcript_30052/g.58974  ORF Transcript_30052/g.58974 Transcript_30052/m.58974 type:complete len:96 (+) Transcript_30052:771-1058(+)
MCRQQERCAWPPTIEVATTRVVAAVAATVNHAAPQINKLGIGAGGAVDDGPLAAHETEVIGQPLQDSMLGRHRRRHQCVTGTAPDVAISSALLMQ